MRKVKCDGFSLVLDEDYEISPELGKELSQLKQDMNMRKIQRNGYSIVLDEDYEIPPELGEELLKSKQDVEDGLAEKPSKQDSNN